MFDFVKMKAAASYAEQLFNAQFLEFDSIPDKKGNQYSKNGYTHYEAQYYDFKIGVWTNGQRFAPLEITGSFHKTCQGGKNFEPFYFVDFRHAARVLTETLDIPLEALAIHVFEFAVNVIPPIPTSDIIEGIKAFKGRKFDRRTFKGKGLLKEISTNQFVLKLYDKAKQNVLEGQLFRIEMRVERMDFVRKNGMDIYTLADLYAGVYNEKLIGLLQSRWRRLIICPESLEVLKKCSNKAERELLLSGLNPNFWTEMNFREYAIWAKRFKQVIFEKSGIDIVNEISTLILSEWACLATC